MDKSICKYTFLYPLLFFLLELIALVISPWPHPGEKGMIGKLGDGHGYTKRKPKFANNLSSPLLYSLSFP